jgi:CheY-like chemotaxis protein
MAKKYKILVIDDDKFLVNMYSKKFEKAGVDVVSSVGSLDALSTLREGQKPDIILLDIVMPDMDGVELLQTIRKEGLAPDALVILLTNESNSDKIKQAKKLGIDDYIIKATKVPSEVVEETLKIANNKLEK